MNHKIVLFPIILTQVYLLFTLWLTFYGPLIWPIENKTIFLSLVLSYQFAFSLGFLMSLSFLKKKTRSHIPSIHQIEFEKVFIEKYWLMLALTFIACMIGHRNLLHTESYIPWDFFSDLKKGFLDPAVVRNYYASAEYAEKFTGNKFVTSLLLVLSFFKYILLPGTILLWDKLSLSKKVCGFLVLLLPIASGVSISISAVNFFYIFTIILYLGLTVLQNRSFMVLKKRLGLIGALIVLILFSISFFYNVKSGTSLLKVSSGEAKPSRMTYLKNMEVAFADDYDGREITALEDLYEKLTVYITNGYVGMSKTLDKKFETTYGLGHSRFLTRVFAQHLGVNLEPRTFQYKVTEEWDKDLFWHSAYSYFANDTGYYGVIVVMFVFGGYLGIVSFSAIILKDFLASLLLPLFGIAILYLPANNQVFSFLETMMPFWFLTIIFILSFIRGQRKQCTLVY